MAILLVASLRGVDKSSIARCVKVNTNTAMMNFLDPIEGDGIIVPRSFGHFVTYHLPDEPWSDSFRTLAEALCSSNAAFRSRINATRDMMKIGRERASLIEHLNTAD